MGIASIKFCFYAACLGLALAMGVVPKPGSSVATGNASAKILPLTCFKPCSFQIDPICTTNGTAYKLFTNKCYLDTFNCEEKHKWKPIHQIYCKKKTKKTITECNRNCDNNPAPLCAFDGETYKVFWNNCKRLESECINDIKYQKVNIENCSRGGNCENTCSKSVKKYICGSDGKIFSWFRSECLLNLRNCETRGAWKEVPLCKCKVKSERILNNICNQKCASYYDPMCGNDGAGNRTFFNVCDMTVYNCLNCSTYKIIGPGRCT